MNIEIHHIDKNPENNKEDNLIPVCYDCHGELGLSNKNHPRGTNYRLKEIKARRGEIYRLHTIAYLRQVEISISRYLYPYRDKKERPRGDYSCTVRTLSTDIPIQLKMKLEIYRNARKMTSSSIDGLYFGTELWNLNPGQIVLGHFPINIQRYSNPFNIRVEVTWSLIDILGFEHEMLPFSYVWSNSDDFWYDPKVGI